MLVRLFLSPCLALGFLGDGAARYLGLGERTDKLIINILQNPAHFEKLGVVIVGQRELPEDIAKGFGLDDIASVQNQFSSSADIVRDSESALNLLFDVEKYADTVRTFPTDLQMSFYQQLWSLLDAADQILEFMLTRAESAARGASVTDTAARPVELENLGVAEDATEQDEEADSAS